MMFRHVLWLAAIVIPPGAAAEDTELVAAMRAIQDDLRSLGPSSDSRVYPDQTGKVAEHTTIFQYSDVVANAQTCTIRFDLKITVDDKTVRDATDELSLRSVKTLDLNPWKIVLSSQPAGRASKFHRLSRCW